MDQRSGFERLSVQYAVQAMLNACYSETLHATADILARRAPECRCASWGDIEPLLEAGIISAGAVAEVRASCGRCRRTLQSAVAAWQSGDVEKLRLELAEYRQAAGEVRAKLVSVAQ